jgi:hypothetical protein
MREGDILSILLFNLYMDQFIMNVKTNSTGTMYNRTWQCPLHADYVTVSGCGMKRTAEQEQV